MHGKRRENFRFFHTRNVHFLALTAKHEKVILITSSSSSSSATTQEFERIDSSFVIVLEDRGSRGDVIDPENRSTDYQRVVFTGW